MAPANSRTPCTDAEFLELWERLKSPAKLARHLGISERGVYSRRRTIEERTGSTIESHGPITPRVPKHGAEHKISVKGGCAVIFGDIHRWPGDTPSLAEVALLNLLPKFENLAFVCMNGDLFDGARISRHGPTEWMNFPTVKEELEACQEFTRSIEEVVPESVPLLWNAGNHDSRFSVKIASEVPDMAGVNGMDLKDHFSPRWSMAWSTLVNEGIIGGTTLIKHRYRGGIHATWNNTLNAGVNICTNHLHQLKVTPITDVNGRRYGVDAGTLSRFKGESKFSYAENNPLNWAEGWALLRWDHEGRMAPPSLCEVVGNVAWFEGKVVASE